MRQDMQLALSRHASEIERLRLLELASKHPHRAGSIAASLARELDAVTFELVAARELAARGEHESAAERAAAGLSALTVLRDNAAREASRHAGAESSVGVAELLSSAREWAGPRLRAGNVTLREPSFPVTGSVRGSRSRLTEALAALLNNAADAAANGARPAQVTVRVEDGPDRRVRIVVEDSGQGFQPGPVPRTFASTRGQSGLGLAVAETVAREHGGELDLTAAGSGRVVLVLPRARAPG
jgi:C4-dicarboxylate-specific signal transduction histidine kinase